MKRLLLTAAAFCAALAARADTAPIVAQPHPAVARIIAPEADGTSYGSGSLVAVNEYYGLVVTNWHVVRDATRQIWVVFPGGFQSPATLMKIDREWDLAALLIWKPNMQPLPVSTQAPQLGERLTIAGYGSGWYRAVSGRCMEYFSPDGNQPAEIVELSVPARNGDSGGPIFNDRGEIAGVLFGSDSSSTMGSYCGRLRRFLSPLAGDFGRLPPPPNMPSQTVIAQQPPAQPINQPPTVAANYSPAPTSSANFSPTQNRGACISPAQSARTPAPQINGVVLGQVTSNTDVKTPQSAHPVAQVASIAPDKKNELKTEAASERKIETLQVNAAIPVAASPENDTLFSQLKSFLAVIGILALFIQCLKILGNATG